MINRWSLKRTTTLALAVLALVTGAVLLKSESGGSANAKDPRGGEFSLRFGESRSVGGAKPESTQRHQNWASGNVRVSR